MFGCFLYFYIYTIYIFFIIPFLWAAMDFLSFLIIALGVFPSIINILILCCYKWKETVEIRELENRMRAEHNLRKEREAAERDAREKIEAAKREYAKQRAHAERARREYAEQRAHAEQRAREERARREYAERRAREERQERERAQREKRSQDQYRHEHQNRYAHSFSDKLNECYKILGCKEGSSLLEIKKCYLELIKKYHPDRFYSAKRDKASIEFATQQAALINNAYEIVREHLGAK